MPEGAIVDPHELLRDLLFVTSGAGAATRSCSARSISRTRDLRKFFGDEDGDELHMAFNFSRSTRRCILALARGEAGPRWKDALEGLPAIPEDCQLGELRPQSRRAHRSTD